jgi:hypothetical protein
VQAFRTHSLEVASAFKARQALCDNADCEQLIGFIRDVLSSVSLHARLASQLLLLSYERVRRELEAIVAEVLRTTLLGAVRGSDRGSIDVVEAIVLFCHAKRLEEDSVRVDETLSAPAAAPHSSSGLPNGGREWIEIIAALLLTIGSAEHLFERLHARYLQARLVDIGFASATAFDSHWVIEAATAVLDREVALLQAIHRVVGKAWGKQCFAQLHEMLRSVRASMQLSMLFNCYARQQLDRELFVPSLARARALQPMPEFGVLVVAERTWDRLWSCPVRLPAELETYACARRAGSSARKVRLCGSSLWRAGASRISSGFSRRRSRGRGCAGATPAARRTSRPTWRRRSRRRTAGLSLSSGAARSKRSCCSRSTRPTR